MSTNDGGALLEVSGLVQRFGGLAAVDGLDLEVQAGSVVGLIGPNGAGKSTVLNILSGVHQPTEGVIRIGGTDVTSWGADRRARRCGVQRTFQTVRLFDTMTVAENVLTAAGAVLGGREAQRSARDAVDRLGLDDVREALAGTLPYGRQRRVEIARAMAAHPDLLLLDEPAAGLSPLERNELADLLTELSDGGMSVLLVEHHMDLVHAVCSAVTVIDFGRPIFHGSVAAAIEDPAVVTSYLGGGVEDTDTAHETNEGAPK